MAIHYEILGRPGRDNALLVTVDSGQSLHRLLFDCGAGCLDSVSPGRLQTIEAVFFSHFHIDHIAGFDSFLRFNWCREDGPVLLLGPPGAISVLHHRLQGFTWNLVHGSAGEIRVSEVGDNSIKTSRFLTSEGFATEHVHGARPFDGVVHAGKTFHVEACLMDHGIPCLAYLVREQSCVNVDVDALSELGVQPGPWLKVVKDREAPDDSEIVVDGTTHRIGSLRDRLLKTTPGESIAYLTDFRLDVNESEDRLCGMLDHCGTIVCENNYRDVDAGLANQNYHMTSADVGRLAARVQSEMLVLFHVSDRYTVDEWRQQLSEVRQHFTRAVFPPEWRISDAADSAANAGPSISPF